MLRTPVCDLLGIEHPIIQAAIWPATSPELVAAVSNAGGLGSLGAVFEPAERLRAQVVRVRELTDRPFAINHVVPLLNEETFAFTLEARPAVREHVLTLDLEGAATPLDERDGARGEARPVERLAAARRGVPAAGPAPGRPA